MTPGGGPHEVQPPLPGLRIQRPEPPPELIEQARAYANRKEWIFAKTMADNPHWYTVLFHQRPPRSGPILWRRSASAQSRWRPLAIDSKRRPLRKADHDRALDGCR